MIDVLYNFNRLHRIGYSLGATPDELKKSAWIRTELDLLNLSVDEAVEIILKKRPYLAHHLESKIGLELQHIDSMMALTIIKTLTDMNISVLTVHDRYLVQDQHKETLRHLMTKTHKNILKTSFLPKIEEKKQERLI